MELGCVGGSGRLYKTLTVNCKRVVVKWERLV